MHLHHPKYPKRDVWPRVGLCLGMFGMAACDAQADEADDIEARAPSLETDELEHDASTLEPVVAGATHEDDCGFGSYHSPVEIRWITTAGALPEVEVDFAIEPEAQHDVQLRFMASTMPTERGAVELGDAISVQGDSRVPMPAELLAAVRSGDAYAAFALLEACNLDDSDTTTDCELRHSGTLYIEDGMTWSPEDYQKYMRDKWSDRKPWLFEHGVVTNVVDMKGK